MDGNIHKPCRRVFCDGIDLNISTILFFYKGGDNINKDNRFLNTGSTPVGSPYYKIWNDSGNIQIPLGQSTSNVFQPENVGVNTRAYGSIEKGVFSAPTVEFENTYGDGYFDSYKLVNERSVFTEENIAQSSDIYVDYTLKISYKDFNVVDKTFTIFYKIGEDFEHNDKQNNVRLDNDIHINYKYMLNYSDLGMSIDVLELYLNINNTIYDMLNIDNIENFGAITVSILDYKIFKLRG